MLKARARGCPTHPNSEHCYATVYDGCSCAVPGLRLPRRPPPPPRTRGPPAGLWAPVLPSLSVPLRGAPASANVVVDYVSMAGLRCGDCGDRTPAEPTCLLDLYFTPTHLHGEAMGILYILYACRVPGRR